MILSVFYKTKEVVNVHVSLKLREKLLKGTVCKYYSSEEFSVNSEEDQTGSEVEESQT